MTFVWFLIWFFANNIGSAEPLLSDNTVSGWGGTLLFAIAFDLLTQYSDDD